MTHVVTTPTPQKALEPIVYARVFENFPEGKLVLEDLVRRFGGDPYVKGGHEGERASCYNAGKRAVLDFIINRINQAAGIQEPATSEE